MGVGAENGEEKEGGREGWKEGLKEGCWNRGKKGRERKIKMLTVAECTPKPA